MTPEQVERLKRVAEAFAEQTPDLAADIRALLAEWEERGREVERLRAELAELQRSYDFMSGEAHKREQAEARLARCVEALEQIGWADPYKGNVIDAMKQTALDALAAAKGKDDDWERRGEALRQIEREGKSASDVWALRCASVARAALEGASVHDPGRLKEALRRVLTEAGMQAHKHGCPNRLVRPARWDEHRPCAGCEAEAALIDTVVAKEG